ncbi:MAG TPA: MmgE/PrpD family protein [Burkholderiales bacterium]|nr:MmgE/PrpD family protein [Burkholderiales bacterium]
MGATLDLASYLVAARRDAIPADVAHEAHRALLNYVGCAIGGSLEPAVELALRALAPFSGTRSAVVLGRAERLDPLHAALMNGISSHVHDYDDTTPKNYIHPTSPVASALLAYASDNPVAGSEFLLAFILGFEAESRVGNAVYPAHYDAGWHITGTAGVFGAAAAVGRLLRLPVQNMVWALGLAATQAAGLREMFGSMGKAFHPGRSAQNGYVAALLAREGFTSGEHGIEGPRGFAPVQAASYDLSKVSDKLGVDFDLRENTYKPFPCGIVIHPTIDACIQIARAHAIKADEITAVRLRVAPLVLDLCNKKDISRGLEGKFSVYHAAAIGLVRGKAGLSEFTDETVNDPQVRAVRERVSATADPGLPEDAVRVEVELSRGGRIGQQVDHAIGNLARPMSDRDLEEKFRDQAARVLPAHQVTDLIALCWRAGDLSDMRELIDAAVPRS